MLLRKLRFIRESMHVDLKAAERRRKCMRTKQTAFKKRFKGGMPSALTRIATYHILLNELKNRKTTPSLPSPPKI